MCIRDRTSSSRPAQIRDTSLLEIPVSAPRALTRSSTLRVDQALFAVVMEAYLHGVSTRKVDDLVKALGADTGISRSEVSRICAGLDEEVSAFRDRPLDQTAFPYVFL